MAVKRKPRAANRPAENALGVELARVLKKTGSFYYHCDWHASHHIKLMLDQIFGENNCRNESTGACLATIN